MKMKQKNMRNIFKILFLLITISITAACLSEGGEVKISKRAAATITGCAETDITGTATLMERESPEGIKLVDIKMEVTGLTDGKHAVHLHETGACDPCGAAKGHFDPGPVGESTPDAPAFNHPYHMGDLINIEVSGGEGRMETTTSRITLSSGPLGIFDADGAAFIIHTKKDTYCDEQVKGCAGGARDACGIIKLS
jgi:Cu-Zn family superoxide dismutase